MALGSDLAFIAKAVAFVKAVEASTAFQDLIESAPEIKAVFLSLQEDLSKIDMAKIVADFEAILPLLKTLG